jgi:hypothetical protein
MLLLWVSPSPQTARHPKTTFSTEVDVAVKETCKPWLVEPTKLAVGVGVAVGFGVGVGVGVGVGNAVGDGVEVEVGVGVGVGEPLLSSCRACAQVNATSVGILPQAPT